MSILDDFNKLHINTKQATIGLITNIPFWYISIFLFQKPFFNSNEFYLPIIFAICLAISHVMLSLVLIYLMFQKQSNTPFFIAASCLSLFLVSLTIYISKTIIKDVDIYQFINCAFAPLIISNVVLNYCFS